MAPETAAPTCLRLAPTRFHADAVVGDLIAGFGEIPLPAARAA